MGMLLALFSSFGQTFLISLFVPHWLEAFLLDTARFGLLVIAASLMIRRRLGATLETTTGGEEPCATTSI